MLEEEEEAVVTGKSKRERRHQRGTVGITLSSAHRLWLELEFDL